MDEGDGQLHTLTVLEQLPERMCTELAVSLRPALNLKIIRRPQQNSYLQNMSSLLNRFAVGHKQSCGLKAFPDAPPPAFRP